MAKKSRAQKLAEYLEDAGGWEVYDEYIQKMCKNCGEHTDRHHKFCPDCGGKLATNTSAVRANKKEVHEFLEEAIQHALGEK